MFTVKNMPILRIIYLSEMRKAKRTLYNDKIIMGLPYRKDYVTRDMCALDIQVIAIQDGRGTNQIQVAQWRIVYLSKMNEISNRTELNTRRTESLEKSSIEIGNDKSAFAQSDRERAGWVCACREERATDSGNLREAVQYDIIKIECRCFEPKPTMRPILPNLA